MNGAGWRHGPSRGPRASIAIFVLIVASAARAGAPVGHCRFDPDRLNFAGSPQAQAACLLRPVGPGGVMGSAPARLPEALRRRLARPVRIDATRLAGYLAATAAARDLADHLLEPVSRARDNDPAAPFARYFVIHDTSQPYLGAAPFPPDIDTSDAVNDLGHYLGPDAVAHVFTNRRGEIVVGHDLSVAWRATKLESQVIGLPAKGLFLHVENQQPRRADPAGAPGNDRIAPTAGFTAAQYDALGLVYIVASVRAGRWLIPAFHAAIDQGLPDAHDDPQNFDLMAFDAAVTRRLAAIRPGRRPRGRLDRQFQAAPAHEMAKIAVAGDQRRVGVDAALGDQRIGQPGP
jgi:hypothetical protein